MIARRLAGLRPRMGVPLCVILALSLMPGTALAQATVTIDWNDLHQTIDGFGTAQAGWAPTLYQWPEPQRSQIVDLAFSQANGIGLTILRNEIMPELESSKGTWNYSDAEQVWLMKQAVNRGATKLIASVWSPPAWMKTNGDVVGGALKTESYQDFANFLSHYAAEYARANSVNIYAVSMTNEPDTPIGRGRLLGSRIASPLFHATGLGDAAPEAPSTWHCPLSANLTVPRDCNDRFRRRAGDTFGAAGGSSCSILLKPARCDFEARKLPVFVILVPHQLIEIAESSFN